MITVIKYWLFFSVCTILWPLITIFAASKKRVFTTLAGVLVFSTCLTGWFDINIVSREWYRGTSRGLEITLADLIAFSLFVAMWFKDKPRKHLFVPGIVLHSLYVMICTLSLVFSREGISPLYGSFAIFQYFKSVFIYWVFYNLIRDETDYGVLVNSLIGIGLFNGAIAVMHRYILHEYRVSGTFDHPNPLGCYMNMVGLVLLACYQHGFVKKKLQRHLCLLALLACACTVILTISRAAITGLGVGTALISAATLVPLLRKFSKRAMISWVFVLSLLALFWAKSADTINERFTNPGTPADARDLMNDFALTLAKKNFFGGGFNNFPHIALKNRDRIGVELPPPHSIYYLTLGELGYAGAIVLALVWTRFILMGLKASKFYHNSIVSGTVRGMLIALFVLLLQAGYDDHPRRTAILYLHSIYFAYLARASSVMKAIEIKPSSGKDEILLPA